MKFTLRPYQKESTDLLRSVLIKARKSSTRSLPILCLPTGAGKTVTFSYLSEQAQRKGSRVGIVCHRIELINQARDTMISYGINPLMITYGMVQTYVRSPHKIPEMDLCIIDECHIGNFRNFINILPDSVQVIGATATPIGASKKKPLREVFTDVVCPVQINELIEDGFLSRPTYHIWEIDDSKLEKIAGEFSEASQSKVFAIENLIEAFEARVGKTLIFTSSINQTLEVYTVIGGSIEENGKNGIFFVHSKIGSKERETIVSLYKSTPDSTMVNCGILTAGFDDPSIETIIVYRATTSVVLWLQMVGRGSRIIKWIKSKFFIYDLGGNRERLLAWEADRDWPVIFDLQGRKLKDKEAPMKKCVECEGIIYASAKFCPLCNAKQPFKDNKPIIAGRVTIIENYSELPEHLKVKYEDMTVSQLIERAAYGSPLLSRPFKNGWILNQLRQRGSEEFPGLVQEFANIKGYKEGWVFRQLTS